MSQGGKEYDLSPNTFALVRKQQQMKNDMLSAREQLEMALQEKSALRAQVTLISAEKDAVLEQTAVLASEHEALKVQLAATLGEMEALKVQLALHLGKLNALAEQVAIMSEEKAALMGEKAALMGELAASTVQRDLLISRVRDSTEKLQSCGHSLHMVHFFAADAARLDQVWI
jgi:predicted nuclease with TOPRIM domain